jgi:CheY-like chemotaxis protein
MSEETRAKAIEPFYTTKEPGKGSGLGLSQVYGFLRQSNGQIGIESTLGQGTTVSMYLPRLVESDAESDTRSRIGTVLITDDDPDVLSIAVETLQVLGYQVYTATNAAEALALLRRDLPVDVLFTDIVMPNGMNGVELAREARRLRPDLPVLLSSGYSRSGVPTDENTAFIPKPYQLPELARQLEAMVARARLH